MGISNDEYDNHIDQDAFTFFCPKCTWAELPSYPSSPDRTYTTIVSDYFSTTGNAHRIVNINVNSIKSTHKKVLFHAFLDDEGPS